MNSRRFIWFLVATATALLAILYLSWYWISPIAEAFKAGRYLFTIYLIVASFWIIVPGKKSYLLNSLLVLFFTSSILYYKNFVSSVLDEAEYEGVQYYITYSQEPFDGWQDYHLTARNGLFQYDSYGLGLVLAGDHLKLKYDTTISKMTIVETKGRIGKEIIFSIDEENPLFYEAIEELDNYTYYLFSSCRKLGVDCQNSIYFLYKCRLDNTYCERLPFMYDGEYGGLSSQLRSHKITSEIEVYLDGEILIYTYGREPRCHIQNCHILDTP